MAQHNNDWLTRLLRWIKRLARRSQRETVSVERSWQSNLGVLHRLKRSVAGAAATYRFIPAYQGQYDLLLTCDQVRWTASPNGAGERRSLEPGSVRASWDVALSARRHPTPTHILALVEVARIPDPLTKTIRVRVRFAYLCDLVGIQTLKHPNHYARFIAADLAQQLLLFHDDEIRWEELINAIADKYVQSNHQILL
ncbi:hypothetical protein IQ268_08795 [Oculatella sp. LEGE 06141]|uniref:hypothetical protein n=1 Tax=Oculatella sp. LEGE 06141 TaxID=1828648 RepID=UPI001881F60A|nr:hypothetical protein [Oculatella sp. LEGE 06141]MBE9178655.1 hypothetical protein [Oculatella sp. LEGE 06141]